MSADGVEHLALPPREDREKARLDELEKTKTVAKEFFAQLDGLEYECHAMYGSYLTEPLRYALDNSIDLIVLSSSFGLPQNKGSKALFARRIARRSTCSLLVVPAGNHCAVKHILTPVRDSEVSQHALETAITIAEQTNAEVVPLNLYQVAGGYSYSSSSPAEHQQLLSQWAMKECENLMGKVKKSDAQVNCLCIPDPYDKPAEMISETASKLGSDLLVIGARGRTGAAGVLLGTVTEEFIRKSKIPVLAVKRKGECMGVLQAIFSLAGSSNPDINFA